MYEKSPSFDGLFFFDSKKLSASGAEAEYAGKEGLCLPEGGFIGRQSLRTRELDNEPAMQSILAERQKRFRHVQSVARIGTEKQNHSRIEKTHPGPEQRGILGKPFAFQ